MIFATYISVKRETNIKLEVSLIENQDLGHICYKSQKCVKTH